MGTTGGLGGGCATGQPGRRGGFDARRPPRGAPGLWRAENGSLKSPWKKGDFMGTQGHIFRKTWDFFRKTWDFLRKPIVVLFCFFWKTMGFLCSRSMGRV